MTIGPDDPRLTAYALGEMTGEERRTFEDEVAGDAGLLAEVKAIAAFAREVESELGRDAPSDLGKERRDFIATRLGAPARPSPAKARADVRWAALSVAGALALAAGALLFFSSKGDSGSAASKADEGRGMASAKAAAMAPAATATATWASAPGGEQVANTDTVHQKFAHGVIACDPHDPLCVDEKGKPAAPSCAPSAMPSASSSACAPPSGRPPDASAPTGRGVPPR